MFTPPLTLSPLSPQVFLNFLVGIRSGANVKITAAAATPPPPPLPAWLPWAIVCTGPFVAFALGRYQGRNALFCRGGAHSFCSGFAWCLVQQMDSFSPGFRGSKRAVCVRLRLCTSAGGACRGVRFGVRIVSGRRISVNRHASRVVDHLYMSVRYCGALRGG